MKSLIRLLALTFFISVGFAQAADAKKEPSAKPAETKAATSATNCEAQAGEKKLAGAAKTSFMKKCEADSKGTDSAAKACEGQAAEKKLAGAAKTSFLKKCETDAKAEKK